MKSETRLLHCTKHQLFEQPMKFVGKIRQHIYKLSLLWNKSINHTSSSKISLPACAILTTSEWLLSITETPFTDSTMSPISRPDDSAGVSDSYKIILSKKLNKTKQRNLTWFDCWNNNWLRAMYSKAKFTRYATHNYSFVSICEIRKIFFLNLSANQHVSNSRDI